MNKLFSRSLRSLCLLSTLVGVSSFAFAAEDPPASSTLPAVQILATDPTGLTDASSAAFTVMRSGEVTASLLVQYTIAGTGVNGTDYTTVGGGLLGETVEIPAGYAAADIVIVPRVNPANRGNKTVTLALATSTLHEIGRHARATVFLIDDLYNDAPPKVTLTVEGGETGPDGVKTFTLPATIDLVAEATDPDDQVVKVTFYANDSVLGSATAAPFVLAWRNPRPGAYEVFARAVDQFGKSSLSEAVSVVVKADLPTVTITNPTETSLVPGTDVRIQAEVTQGSGAITEVQFYGDGHLLATLTRAPYETTWAKIPAGRHTIMVRVTDELGLTAAARFTFTAQNKKPTVRITAPEPGERFQAPATLTITAEATDPENHAIQQVTFYANGREIGAVTTAPYTLEWKEVGIGHYRIQAVATDEFGARGQSPLVPIFVSR